jgi:DNA-binding NtrC family response regulator
MKKASAAWTTQGRGATLADVACGGCILVVDDDPEIREALTCCLQELGCTCVAAADGLEALEQLDRCPRPCVVLLDLMMPRLDGEACARRIRGSERHHAVPIVSMSAGPQRLFPPIVCCHLAKPFDFQKMSLIIGGLCQRPGAFLLPP